MIHTCVEVSKGVASQSPSITTMRDLKCLIGIRVRRDGGVGVQEPQHFLQDGWPATVLGPAGHTVDLLLLIS